jgi:hypothetical protein
MEPEIKRMWTAVAIIVFVGIILFFVGGGMTEQCVQIGDCQACWNTKAVEIESTLCANQTCTPEPYKVQHNAIVDTIVCACNQIENEDVKEGIKKLFAAMNCPPELDECSYDFSVEEICRGALLVKWRYE